MADDIYLATTSDDGKQVTDISYFGKTAISTSGRYIAFLAYSSTLEDGTPANPGGLDGYWYIKDTTTGQLARVEAEDLTAADGENPNILSESYNVSLSDAEGVVVYGDHAATFDLATGQITHVLTVPELDPDSSVVRTFDDTRHVFTWSFGVDMTGGSDDDILGNINMIDTATNSTTTIKLPVNSYADRDDGNFTLTIKENADVMATSSDGKFMLVELPLYIAKAGHPNGFSSGLASIDYAVYNTESGGFTRLSNHNATVAADFTGNSDFLDAADIQGSLFKMSDDGKFAVFSSAASTFVDGDTNNASDVFLMNLQNGNVSRISVDSKGRQLDAASGGATISGDGKYIAFWSEAAGIGTTGSVDLYVEDRITGEIRKANIAENGSDPDIITSPVEITTDGKYLTFGSPNGSAFVTDDDNGHADAYRVDNPFVSGGGSGDNPPSHLALSKTSVAEDAKVKAVVGTFSADDEHIKTLTYTLASNPGGFFKIVGDKLEVAKALDYETAQDHKIKVTVEDAGGHAVTKTFTIDVTDVMEDISGNAKGNKINGGIGADHILGLGGKDTLNGKDGNDLIDGGTDNDKLTGGAGADTFVFAKGSGKDEITDFTSGADKLDFSAVKEIGSFSELKSDHITDKGSYLLIDWNNGHDSVKLDGIDNIHDIGKGDFIFH